MRLTLRTLLAYLDDTLEPAQAKLIGQKVAESDTAQELIARIKQVTRRRRLTVPPQTGPGGKLDPNTVAEYLDNALSADQTAEVEQTCLGSDVHLAEIAACHQILTLVLGEPVLIPPSSRQRMYGLVKGREAIPFRRPPARAEQEPEAAPDLETDETLRLGLPAYRSRGSWSSRLAVVGGGLAAALLLALAIWQAIRLPSRPEAETGTTVAQNKGEPTGPPVTTAKEGTPAGQTGKGTSAPAGKDEHTDTGTTAKKDQETTAKQTGKPGETGKKDDGDAGGLQREKLKPGNTTEEKNVPPKKTIPPKKAPMESAVPVASPSAKEKQVGRYLTTAEAGPSLVLERESPPPKVSWHILDARDPTVFTARPLVSLPGCRSAVQLKTGLRLTLWGALPEELLFPDVLRDLLQINLQEGRAVLHDNADLDADLTLERGRLILTNPQQKALRVRLRFDNPTNPLLPEVWDVTLEEPGTDALVDLWHYYPIGEPFYPDASSRRRAGPVAAGHLIVRAGAVSLHRNDETLRLEATPTKAPLISWDSRKGTGDRMALPGVPYWATARPTPPGIEKDKAFAGFLKVRAAMSSARDNLVKGLSGRGDKVDAALAGILTNSSDPAEHVLIVRCYGALDDLPDLVDALGNEERPVVRAAAIETLRLWIADARDNDYRLLGELKTKYSKVESENIMRLLHSFSPPEAKQAETYNYLILTLNNPRIALRELAAWHLYRLDQADGAKIHYAAQDPVELRQQAQIQWGRLLDQGKLPPPQRPPPGGPAPPK